MHLLYARFWTKVLFDLGLVQCKEPFRRLMNQGQVLGNTPYRAPKEGERLDVGEDGILIDRRVWRPGLAFRAGIADSTGVAARRQLRRSRDSQPHGAQ